MFVDDILSSQYLDLQFTIYLRIYYYTINNYMENGCLCLNIFYVKLSIFVRDNLSKTHFIMVS